MRHPFIILSLTLLLSLASRAWALDPRIGTGVSGLSGAARVTAGSGRATDDGLAHPGFPSRTGAGMIGVTSGGVKGGTNMSSDDGFHAAGLGKVITAGIGQSTMDSVPGRTPTYIHVVSGTRYAPLVGGRGP